MSVGLRLKFNLIIAACFVASIGAAAFGAPLLERWLSERSARSQAVIAMAELEAVIRYNAAEISPLLERASGVQFLPQSVPFFAAKQAFARFAQHHPGFSLRQTADNPTNKRDQPEIWEAEIIARFRAEPQLESITTKRMVLDKIVVSYARPVRAEQSCLSCHGAPAAAPQSMIDVYGTEGGFGWKDQSVVGAQIISVTGDIDRSGALLFVLTLLGCIGATFALVQGVLYGSLQWLVIQPIRTMAQVADEVSLGKANAPEFETKLGGELGLLAISFNRMRRSLEAALRWIGDETL